MRTSLTSQEVERYAYKYFRDEHVDGREAFLLERYRTYKYSGYTRQVAWMDKAIYRLLKLEYYDRKGALLKTLSFHDYRQYLDKYWRPGRMEMVNHQTGKSTTLLWKNRRFRTGLSEQDFDRSSLKRVR